MAIFNFIIKPLGQFLNLIYEYVTFNNYGFALILFTIIIRAAMLPLTIKQYKSTGRMQEIQPQLQDVQKRYKNDKQKLQEETMKLYQEHKVNPAGGCLPLLVQMPIFLSLWQVISKPLSNMLGWSSVKIGQYATDLGIGKATYQELEIIQEQLKQHGEKIIDMNFLGMNMGLVPNWHPDVIMKDLQYLPLLLIPIIAVITSFISAKLSMPKTTQGNANPMQNSMLYIAPLMSLIFLFTFPAGMGLYWIAGNVVQILQQLYINKYVLKKKEVVSK